jgi:uncharacterized protein YjeT (DUF2065 family)
MWHAFLVALALMLVLEGIWPFLNPNGFRRVLIEAASADDRMLRITGLISMILGVALLYFLN